MPDERSRPVASDEPEATLTIEIYRLSDDPAAPRWKFEARLTDGLTVPPVLATGRGPTYSEAIRHMALQLPREADDAR